MVADLGIAGSADQGGRRQVKDTRNALVTGIGWINYGRNWGSSSVLALAPNE